MIHKKVLKNLQDSNYQKNNTILLLLGQFVSQFGDQVFIVALLTFMIQGNFSSTQIGLVTAATILPLVILGPFGGAIGDSMSRKMILVFSDIARGLIILILFLLPFQNFYWVFLISLLNGLCTALFDPTIMASTADIVDQPESVFKIQSNLVLIRNLSEVAGPAIGGAAIAIINLEVFFLINAMSFIVSGISELFIIFDEKIKSKTNIKKILKETAGGLVFIKRNKILKNIMPMFSIMNMFIISLIMVLVPMLFKNMREYSLLIGTYYSFVGIGGVCGAILASKLKIRDINQLYIHVLFISLSVLLLKINSNIAYFSSGFFIGMFTANVQIISNQIFLTEVPDNMRGKIFAFRRTFSQVFVPLGNIIMGIIVKHVSIDFAIFYVSIGVVFLSVWMYVVKANYE